jgi:cytochrome b pre-mRNA-processing protein 3
MPSQLLKRLMEWRSSRLRGQKLYGAIVAQARLPVFYRNLGVSDTLEGRFGLLALHLFAVLHSLRSRDAEAARFAQVLTDRFTADMDTVLRELGVSDLRVPKAMRALAASSRAIVERYGKAMASGTEELAATIADSLPFRDNKAGLSSRSLASYVRESSSRIELQSVPELEAGTVDFAGPPETP